MSSEDPLPASTFYSPPPTRPFRTPSSTSQASSHGYGSATSTEVDPEGFYRLHIASQDSNIQATPESQISSLLGNYQSQAISSNSNPIGTTSSNLSAEGSVKRRGHSGIQQGAIGDKIKAFNNVNNGASPRDVGLAGSRSSSLTHGTVYKQQTASSRHRAQTGHTSSRIPRFRSQSSPDTRSDRIKEDGGIQVLLFGELPADSETGVLGQGIPAITHPSMAPLLNSISEGSHRPFVGIDFSMGRSAPGDSDIFGSSVQTQELLPPRSYYAAGSRRRSDADAHADAGNSSPSRAFTTNGAEHSVANVGQDSYHRRQPLAPSYIKPKPRSRYSPIRVNNHPQALNAMVHGSPSKTSPTLRSSRPRQPVANASTAASRAKLAERFEKQSAATQYRLRGEFGRPRPQVPGGVDVAARRARLQDKMTVSNPALNAEFEGHRNTSLMKRAKSRDQLRNKDEVERTIPESVSQPDAETASHQEYGQSVNGADMSDVSEAYGTPASTGSVDESLQSVDGANGSGTDDHTGERNSGRSGEDFYSHIRRIRDSSLTEAAQTSAVSDFLSDDGETIQIALGKTPVLPEWTPETAVPSIPGHFLSMADDNLDTRSIFPDDSVSVVFGPNSARPPRQTPPPNADNSQHTLDSAARSQINRVFEDYHHHAHEENVTDDDQSHSTDFIDDSEDLQSGDVTPADVGADVEWMDLAEPNSADPGLLLTSAVYNPSGFRATARKPVHAAVPASSHQLQRSHTEGYHADDSVIHVPETRAHVHSLSNTTLGSDVTVREATAAGASIASTVSQAAYSGVPYQSNFSDILSTRAHSSSAALGTEHIPNPRIAHSFEASFDAERQLKRSDSLAPDSRSGDTGSMRSQASSISYDAGSAPSNRPTTSNTGEREFNAMTLSPSNRFSSASTSTTDPRGASIDTAATSMEASIPRRPVSTGSKQKSVEKELNERRNCIKEIVDTEASYSRDIQLTCSIYLGTAPDILSLEDRRTLFGNIGAIKDFSIGFLDALRHGAASVYSINRENLALPRRDSRGTSTSGNTDESAMTFSAATEKERSAMDARTSIGQAFLKHLDAIEKIYTEWIVKTNDAANARLRELQQKPNTKLWLDACYDQIKDLTQAWSLDALLIKPAQRLMKYPLLLTALLKCTRSDHPDFAALKKASDAVLLLTSRINESKKRAELVEQAMNRKRKDSDVKISVGKLLNRRTEKFKQHAGLLVVTDDQEYAVLEQKHGGHYFQLQVVLRDIENYVEKCQGTIGGLVVIVRDFIEMLSFNRTSGHAEYESNWIRIFQTVQALQSTALQDHVADIRSKVIDPIQTLWNLYAGPKKMMDKRKSKFVDHVRYKTTLERGEQPDKKLQKEEDEYCAVNEVLKEELPKLYALTKKLMHACIRNLVDLQVNWQKLSSEKLSIFGEAGVSEDGLTMLMNRAAFAQQLQTSCAADIAERDAEAQTLGICNGALLAEISNMLSPVPSQVRDDSFITTRPRQATFSGEQRSVSSYSVDDSASTGKAYVPRQYDTFSPKVASPTTGDFRYGQNGPYESSVPSHGRTRSTYSGKEPVTPRTTSGYLTPQTHMSGPSNGYNEHSSALMQGLYGMEDASSTRSSTRAPPMPSEIQSSARSTRSQQSRQSGPTHDRRMSGIFSSALPMSDSPPSPVPSLTGPQVPATVLYLAASLFEFNIDGSRREGGFPYLRYVPGEIFDVLAQKGELWLARNQDDSSGLVGWIWEKHFARIMPDDE